MFFTALLVAIHTQKTASYENCPKSQFPLKEIKAKSCSGAVCVCVCARTRALFCFFRLASTVQSICRRVFAGSAGPADRTRPLHHILPRRFLPLFPSSRSQAGKSLTTLRLGLSLLQLPFPGPAQHTDP